MFIAAEGDGTPNFCAWVSRLGGQARLLIPPIDGSAALALAAELEAAGVQVCTATGSADACLDGVRLLHLEARLVVASKLSNFMRGVVEAARRRGALVSIELGEAGWIHAHGASLTAYQLAALRADIMFASRAAAAELGAPLEGLASVPVVMLGSGGCSVHGRRLVAPEDVVVELDGSGAGDAFAAAFCVSFVDGAAPVEAAGRAVLVAAAAVTRASAQP